MIDYECTLGDCGAAGQRKDRACRNQSANSSPDLQAVIEEKGKT